MARQTVRPSGRGPAPSTSRLGAMPRRTKVLLAALGLAVVGILSYPAMSMLTGSGAPERVPVSSEEIRDFEALRAMSIDELIRERKKRAAALDACAATGDTPPAQLDAARQAAYRASVALHEKQPPADR